MEIFKIFEMKNFSVEFAKNGNDGNKLLKGGEFQVTSTKTKQITDKWTSGEHIFMSLKI